MQTNYGDLPINIDEKTGRARTLPNRLGTNNGVAPRQASVAPAPGPRVSSDDDTPRYRSKLEARYAGHLEAQQHVGEIRDIRYESVTFKLAKKTTLTPDFWVELPDRTVEIHEVKGRMREDAWVKLKVAAGRWPHFRWFLVTRKNGEWIIKRVPSA